MAPAPHSQRLLRATILLGVVSVPLISGCGEIEGSGQASTSTIEVGDFDEVEVGGEFEALVTVQDGPPSVTVTVDDNFVDHLDVGVTDGRLQIDLRSGSYDPQVTPTAVVTVPSLDVIDVRDASRLIASGIDGQRLTIKASDASEATIEAAVTDLELDLTDATSVDVNGTSQSVRLNAGEASTADLTGLSTVTAVVDLSGSSVTDLGEVATIDVVATEASHLQAPATATRSVDSRDNSSVSFVEPPEGS